MKYGYFEEAGIFVNLAILLKALVRILVLPQNT
jgi:hypothetical protein